MTTRVGINGFGRIGRQVLRAAIENHPDELEVVAVNDLTDTGTNAHLFKYDTNYGVYPGAVEAGESSIVIDGRRVQVLSDRDPAALPWGDLGVDVVVESTGFFTDAGRASGTPGGRRQEGDHIGARQRRGPDPRHGRQRRPLRPTAPQRALQRLLHDQLHRDYGQGA